jgi:hypothetical protein
VSDPATPPITAFLTRLDTAGLVELVQDLDPDARVEEDGQGGMRLVACVLHPAGVLSVTLQYDPEYLEGAEGAAQRRGMQEYFRRFPCDPTRISRVVAAIPVLTDAVTVQYQPDQLEDMDDPRDGLVWGLAKRFDGVVFLPGVLFDAEGRVLLSAAGEVDADAALPADAPEPQAPLADDAEADLAWVDEEDGEDDEAVPPPAADRVARRAVVLAGVAARSMLEQMHGAGEDMRGSLARLQAWLGALGVRDEAEDDEWAHVHTALGALDPQDAINGMWRLEGLGVLAWALGRFDLPRYDTLVDPDAVLLGLGLMDVAAARALLDTPELIDDDVLDAFADQALAVHWRLREHSLRPEPLDLTDFAERCWFGPIDASWAELADGDLALEGSAVGAASDDARGRVHSSALERHQAILWLRGQRARYSAIDTAT